MVSIGQWGWRPVLIRHVTSQLPAFAHEYAPDWARESKLFTTSRPSGSLSTSMGLRFPNAGTIPVSHTDSAILVIERQISASAKGLSERYLSLTRPTGDFKNDAFLQFTDFLEDAFSDLWWQNSGHWGRLPQFLRSVGSPQCLTPLAMLQDVFPLKPQACRT